MNPYFSIVVPTFNRGFIIEETLQYIFNQSFQDFEVIVVDDGSTDDTKDILDRLGNQNATLSFYQKENGERGAARNYGFQRANGKYVVFFDSDDIMLTDHLQTLFEKIQSLNEAVNFIASKFSFIYDDGKTTSSAITAFSEGWHDYTLFLNGNHLACNICVKKNNPNLIPFEEDRGYAILEDWMFHVENLKNDRLYLIDQVTIQMRKHDDRSMENHQAIIERRIKANDYLIGKVDLTDKEIRFMTAHSYYFCAIHAYLDRKRSQAMKLLNKSISSIGMQSLFLVLYLKILVGRKTIEFIKR